MKLKRCGVTLIEMAVVITLQAILLAVAVTFIGRVLEADREHREEVQSLASLHSLAEQFRSDVHLAKSASPDESSLELQLSDDLAVRYESGEGRVTRIERREDQVVRRDLFRLLRDWPVSFEPASDGPATEVRLNVSRWTWNAVMSKE